MSIFLALTAMVTMAHSLKASPPVSVLVLGTYHMANPKLDLIKTDIRDTLGADRQADIADLNARLAKFRPTKIVIEAVPPAEGIETAYEKYLGGGADLAPDEREQIGFRLGKLFGLKRLYAVDYRMGMDFDELMASAQKQGKTGFLNYIQAIQPKMAKILSNLDKNHTVGEILAAMNSPLGLRANHSFYMKLLDVDDGTDFIGSDVVAGWYLRNLRIFSNIKRIAGPGDRLLVIFGAGHAKHLSDFVAQTEGWKLEDPMKYLPKAPNIDWG